MHRLVNDDANKSAPKSPDARAPKEAAGGGKALKVALAVALFAASGFVLYSQGVFGGSEAANKSAPAMEPAAAKQFQEDVRRAEEVSRERQKAVEQGRAPKPITSQNN